MNSREKIQQCKIQKILSISVINYNSVREGQVNPQLGNFNLFFSYYMLIDYRETQLIYRK